MSGDFDLRIGIAEYTDQVNIRVKNLPLNKSKNRVAKSGPILLNLFFNKLLRDKYFFILNHHYINTRLTVRNIYLF